MELRFMRDGPGPIGFAILNCYDIGKEDEPIAIFVRDSSFTMRRFERIRSEHFVRPDPGTLDPSQCPIRKICVQKGRTTQREIASGQWYSAVSTDNVLRGLPRVLTTVSTFQALLEAAKTGIGDEAWLLCTKEDIDINTRDSEGRTALLYAASCGDEKIVSMLLG